MWNLHCKNLHILFTLQVALFRVLWAVGIGDIFNVESVKTDIMNLSKRQTTPWTKCSISPQSLFGGVRLRLENFPQIFVASRSGRLNLVFHWWAAWPSWQPLWWGEISFQNSRALFLRGFPTFKRINRVCSYRFDGFLWNLAKMSLDYQCAKPWEAVLIFQVFSLLRARNLRRSANIQFANFKIDFLGN